MLHARLPCDTPLPCLCAPQKPDLVANLHRNGLTYIRMYIRPVDTSRIERTVNSDERDVPLAALRDLPRVLRLAASHLLVISRWRDASRRGSGKSTRTNARDCVPYEYDSVLRDRQIERTQRRAILHCRGPLHFYIATRKSP